MEIVCERTSDKNIKADSSAGSLKVTIGIPAYNEKRSIGALIDGLASEIDSNVIEMVVYDDGSTDGTGEEVLHKIKEIKNHGFSLKLIRSEKRLGKAAAIGEIIRAAKGDLVVLVDADAVILPSCVDKITKPFSKWKKAGVVTGNVLPLAIEGKSGFFSFVSSFQRELTHQLSLKLVNEGLAPKVNGAFFAVRRVVVSHIPLSVVSDDEYISWHVQQKGCLVLYASDAKVAAMDPMNLRDYISKRKRVLGGHYLIRNTSRHTVPTTRIMILLPEFGRSVVKHWKNLFYVSVMLLLEFGCRVFAFHDALQGKVSPFYRADSSKLDFKNEEPKRFYG